MSFEKEFLRYTKKNKVLKLDSLAEKWGVEMYEITWLICKHSDKFGDIRFIDEGVYLDYNDNERWYYETGEGTQYKGKRTFKRHINVRAEEIGEVFQECEGLPDQHLSVFMHDSKWNRDFNSRNTRVKAAYVYVELDRGGDLEKAIEDANEIVRQFPFHNGVVVWHSGNTSAHIGIPTEYFGNPIVSASKACGRGKFWYNLGHKIGGFCRFDNEGFDPHLSSLDDARDMYKELFREEPPDDPQFVRQSIEHFDPNLYYTNSMIRMPGSAHEKTGECKILINMPAHDPDPTIEIKPYLLHWCYEAWEQRKPPRSGGKHTNVSDKAPFVIKFFSEHFENFDPDDMNSAGWLYGLHSPFYEDHNPDVSVCVDPESNMFGAYRDFGNRDDDTDFVGFVSKIIGKSRRAAQEYIRIKS